MREARPTTSPWEILFLISHFLEPETLAVASNVCKTWREAFTSNHLWRPICLSIYPCSSHLLSSGISLYRLFSLLQSASKRRNIHPSPVRLSLNQLFFAIEIFHGKDTLVSVLKPGEDAMPKNDCTFRFKVDLTGMNAGELRDTGELRVTWTAVMKGFNGAFAMMERESEGKMIGGDQTQIWFNEKLPVPDCCKGLMSDQESTGMGAEAEMMVEIGKGQNGKRIVERVFVGLMSGCRYVAMEDGLRYLQYFLLGREKNGN